MSGLRAFIGSRDAAMRPPGILDQNQPHPGHTNDRVKAKMQEMGFVNVQDKSHMMREQNGTKSRHQILGEQGRVSLPQLQRKTPVSSSKNNRWHGYTSNNTLQRTVNDRPQSTEASVQGCESRPDIFDTDLENLDSTVAGSDVEDNHASRGSLSNKGVVNGLDRFHDREPSRGRRSSSAVERIQRRHDDQDLSDAPENNDMMTDEEDYHFDGSEVEINDDDVTEQEDLTVEFSPRPAEKVDRGARSQHRSQGLQGKGIAKEICESPSRGRSEPQRMKAEVFMRAESAVPTITPSFNNPNVLDEANGLLFPKGDGVASSTQGQKREIELDYNPTQLCEMSYERLRQEDFDQSPQVTIVKPQSVADASLPEKIQHMYDLKGHADQLHLQRRTFFADLTIDQYEECGDLMMGKFNDIVGRIKAARQQKRTAAREFEEEIARREDRVRAKKNAVDQDLARLKKAGEDVVRGKGA